MKYRIFSLVISICIISLSSIGATVRPRRGHVMGADESLQGQEESNIYTVREGNHTSFKYNLTSGDIFTYSFEVKSGPPIDVFLMKADEYEDYKDKFKFDYYEENSSIEAKEGRGEYEAEEDIEIYVVLDGTDSAGSIYGNSTEDREEESKVKYVNFIMDRDSIENLGKLCCYGGVISIIIVIALVIFLVYQFIFRESEEDKREYYQTLSELSYSKDLRTCPRCRKKSLEVEETHVKCMDCGYERGKKES
ncbi:MAG: hypothetical protein V5A88_03075 [Candidatus Thermoplasmatota archaeon]